jgi:hypothetical protein
VGNSVQLVSREDVESVIRDVVREEIARSLEPLLSAIVVRQKDAADLAETSARTLSNKIASGDLTVLAADGSRKHYFTLQTIEDLKQRRVRK